MRAEFRLSIMRKLMFVRRSAEFRTTGTFTRPKEMWPFQIGRDILLLPKRPPWRIAGHCVAQWEGAARPQKPTCSRQKTAASNASKPGAKALRFDGRCAYDRPIAGLRS